MQINFTSCLYTVATPYKTPDVSRFVAQFVFWPPTPSYF